MAANKLEFFFDFISPYAYFAHDQLHSFCEEHELTLEYRPVVFGVLLDRWGHLGPAEIPPKREWLIKFCLYYAEKQNLPFTFPPQHPFNPLHALRASLASVCGDSQYDLIQALFRGAWVEGQDLSNQATVLKICEQVGMDANTVASLINSDTVKSELKLELERAVDLGIFGVPTLKYDGDLYWGSDQFDYLSAVIKGEYHHNQERLQQLLSGPRGIDRKRK